MQDTKVAELERKVAAEPLNADLRHLLAGEYAQAGDYERAGREFQEVLILNPGAHVARFQLGLLDLTRGQAGRAIAVWAPLEMLPEGSPLKSFKRGLEALIRDEFESCARLLEEGIRANTQIPPLNDDMRRILAKLPARKSADGEEQRTDFSLYGPIRH